MSELIRSRRFQTAIVGIIVAVAIQLFPALDGQEAELTNIVGLIVLALLGSYTVDHATYNLGMGKVEAANARPYAAQSDASAHIPSGAPPLRARGAAYGNSDADT